MINIRLAKLDDIDRVMKFYRENWNENHPMGNFRELMEFQHVIKNEFRYVLAEEEGKICGAIGYIQYNDSETPDISTTMVCVADGTDGILSIEMTEYLEEAIHCRYHFGSGMDPRIGGLTAKARGSWLERMKHFYRLSDRDCYKVARIMNKVILPMKKDSREQSSLVELQSVKELAECLNDEYLRSRVCYKDKNYFIHRYMKHPVYHYHLWKWKDGVLIGRVQRYKNVKVLRIVDWIGEDESLNGLGIALDQWMLTEDIEYVDFYCYGISTEIMKRAGFTERTEDDVNIIPNYFSPYTPANKEIYVSLSKEYAEELHAFRGDSDQDRPNFVYRIEEVPDVRRVPYWSKKGYLLTDRLQKVKVPLKRNTVDFAKYIRMEIILTDKFREEICQIAEESFVYDTRFSVTHPVDDELRKQRIRDYVTGCDEWFVCKYKEKIIGFLVPKIENSREVSIYLAAVNPEYRISGAATSLYYYVAQYYKEQGFTTLLGRISSRNVDVANIYLSMGGRFAEARDVYLLETKEA